MNYLIIGSGAVGGSLAGFLFAGGKDVAVMARGATLEAIRKNGLIVQSDKKGTIKADVTAYASDDQPKKYDVIFVCVKYYSIDEIIPFIEKAAHKDTMVIPILNVIATGSKLAGIFPELTVFDGCVYIIGDMPEPGVATQKNIFRVVFGTPEGRKGNPEGAAQVQADLTECGVRAILSEDVRRDCFRKFAFISTFAAAGQYYNVTAGDLSEPGEKNDTVIALSRELVDLTNKMGIKMDVDLVESGLKTLKEMGSETISSMQRDIKNGKPSEVDGLVFDVVRMGRDYGVDMPVYTRIATTLGYKGD